MTENTSTTGATGATGGSGGGSRSTAADDEPKFSREELVEAFPPALLAGALHGERKQNFTRAEVERAIDKWRKREVESEQGQPDPDEEA